MGGKEQNPHNVSHVRIVALIHHQTMQNQHQIRYHNQNEEIADEQRWNCELGLPEYLDDAPQLIGVVRLGEGHRVLPGPFEYVEHDAVGNDRHNDEEEVEWEVDECDKVSRLLVHRATEVELKDEWYRHCEEHAQQPCAEKHLFRSKRSSQVIIHQFYHLNFAQIDVDAF